MSYRKLLEDYQQGVLSEEQKAVLEADIDRQEAIGEYLFNLDRNLFDSGNDDPYLSESLDEQSKAFVEAVNRTVRRTLMKVGILAALIVFAVFLILPHLLCLLYYNPSATVGMDNNQLSRDWAIWSEVTMPGNIYDTAEVYSEGAGRYSFTLYQSVNHTMTPSAPYAGRIDRGKLQLYTPEAVQKPSLNLFASAQLNPNQTISSQEDKQYFIWAAGNAESAWNALKQLDDTALYTGYISFEKPLSLSETRRILSKLDISTAWYAVQTSEDSNTGPILGMRSTFEGRSFDWDNETYPWLFPVRKTVVSSEEDKPSFWKSMRRKLLGYPNESYLNLTDSEALSKDEACMTAHFISMLRYLDDQKQFRRMVGDYDAFIDEPYDSAADFVEQNGLHIYGIAVISQRDNLLKLKNDERVYGVTTEPLS